MKNFQIIFIFIFALFLSCAQEGEDSNSLIIGNKVVSNTFSITLPSDNTYGASQNLDFVVTHPANLTITGTPYLDLTVGENLYQADYVSGSGTKSVTFRYTIQAGDEDLDGVEIGSDINLAGGTVQYSTNGVLNTAPTSIASIPTSEILVDSSAPSITGVSSPVPFTYRLGEKLYFVFTFDDQILVSGGTPRLQINVGGVTKYANYISGTGTSILIFTYNISATDFDADGIALTSPIQANGATITDLGGNTANLAFTAPDTSLALVDGTAPYVTSFSLPTNQTYFNGELITVGLVFNQVVNVTGTPTINLAIGASNRSASYVSGDGTNTLNFQYLVTGADIDANGIRIGNSISLPGGATIQDGGADNALLDMYPPLTPGVLVYGLTPAIVSVTAPVDGDYVTSGFLDFTLLYSEDVVITNVPQLSINIGGVTQTASYYSGTGTDEIVFRYTVQAGDVDNDGIGFQSSLIDLNTSGTVKSVFSGTDADLDFTGQEPVMTGVTVNQTPATKLVITTEPTDTYVNDDITPAIVVEVRDAGDAVVTSYNENVTIAFGANPGGATLGGTLTVAAVNGIATFSDIDLNVVSSGYTLTVSSGALTTDTSVAFDILASNATKLAFVTQPTNAVAGVGISPNITVEIRDATDTIVTSATNNITLSFDTDPSSATATLGGTLTVAAVAGVATFSGINIDKAFTGYTLKAEAASLTTDTSSSFDITANTKSQLAFIVQPPNSEVDTVLSPAFTVEIQDTYGNKTADNDNITVSINNDPPGGTSLTGSLMVGASNGTATFSNTQLNKIGVGFTLDAVSGSLTTATSTAFDITSTPTQLVITTEPTNTYKDFSISPDITVEIRDGSNNLVTSADDEITVAIGTNPAAGTLSGTLTVAAINGVATFSDLSIDNVGSGYTLVFSATGLTSDTSTTFDINQPPATQLAFTTEPTNAVAGVGISPSIVVEVQDAAGNRVTSATDSITLSFDTDPSGTTANLSGTLTIDAVAGVATFPGINIDKAFTGYTLKATAAGLTQDISASFDITPAAKTKLGFKIQPANSNENTVITPAIEVSILDAFDNIVTSATDSVVIGFGTDPSSGSATLGGTLTQSASAGVATFNNLQINWPETGYTFSATSGSLTTAVSNSFNIFGTPTKLAFGIQPADTEIGNNIGNFTVEIQDSAGNVVATADNVITIILGADPSAGSATLSGTLNVAATAGIATFSALNLDEAYPDYTLVAASGSLTSATSTPFDITISPPNSLTLSAGTTSPSSDTTPNIDVATVAIGDTVKLYTDSACTVANEIASYTATATTATITTNSLAEGTYTIYATRTSGAGNTSVCSTANVTYQVSGSFYQLDSFANNDFGNWDETTGDRSWSTDSDDTQTSGVGPSAPKAGTHYAYTEASNPTGASDEFILLSNTVNGSTADLAFSFFWNKRGDNMGDLYFEASNDGGSTWTTIWSHLGSDVATNGTDTWNEEWFDLCDAGYTASNVQLRFRGVMPASGTIADSDMGVDELEITSGGCLPGDPASISIDSPNANQIIGVTNMDSFTVSGTCSDNGENIAFSGDVSGSTTCTTGTWSKVFDLSAHPDGDLEIRVDHTSATGGPNGTDSVTYTKDSITIQFDDFETLGNWTQNTVDDNWDFTATTGDTPTVNVGPSSGQGGSGTYLFTEASSPTSNSDEFILESNSLDADSYDMDFKFYWNKRGDSMGTIYVEVSPDDGATWDTASFTHTGADVAKGGTDVWNLETLDLCTLGYNSGTLKVRFRIVMPATGNPKDSDIGIDSVRVTTEGCQ